MKKVRALQVCFVLGSRRKVGDEFNVPNKTALQTKGMAPVMELVDGDPSRAPKKNGRFKKKAADTEAED